MEKKKTGWEEQDKGGRQLWTHGSVVGGAVNAMVRHDPDAVEIGAVVASQPQVANVAVGGILRKNKLHGQALFDAGGERHLDRALLGVCGVGRGN